ncbi:hypothetical protein POF50_001545 [Streptomyces sp. SL13]|jgi:hypothetical protein|uniref:Uncharacterized protein n=1 Tax=Streptantibioticus silvisoli TaxID=2705255 RepID=A0AA90GZ53_9ACTN|nr:hypothetical protein [Streptantibioticus silvisoli]MDI5961465.1 hypothetical protein [Streptantibioticus silvisoli]MDI5968048.1 hypothetical protein [Streptantibioticus silvisoli]
MSADGSEELLVTIQPLAATAAAEGEYRPWLGLMVVFGCPVLLAILVFVALIMR